MPRVLGNGRRVPLSLVASVCLWAWLAMRFGAAPHLDRHRDALSSVPYLRLGSSSLWQHTSYLSTSDGMLAPRLVHIGRD